MRWFVLPTLFLCIACPLTAADDPEMIAKQKAKVLDYLKKCDVAKPVIVETDNLLVTGDLPEERLKSLSVAAQKSFAATFKAMKFEMLESPPKGKLAIYFFPERKKYSLFVGELLNERVEKDERSHMDARSNEPYVAVSVLPGEKATDLDVEASGQIAVALLQCKAGPATLPGWMKDAFAKIMWMRAEPAAAAKDRAAIRKLVLAVKGKMPVYKASDVWTAPFDLDKKTLAPSIVEYLAFGPEAAKFAKILGNFRTSDDVQMPTLATALMAVDITPEAFDKGWRKWVLTGK